MAPVSGPFSLLSLSPGGGLTADLAGKGFGALDPHGALVHKMPGAPRQTDSKGLILEDVPANLSKVVTPPTRCCRTLDGPFQVPCRSF
jgi:hypothetical protein